MADQVSDQVYGIDLPTGRRLESGDPREVVFEVIEGYTPADAHRLKVARQHFTEASEGDFDREGKLWVNRHTGERFRRVAFDPTLSEDPSDTGVSTFYVVDEHLVFLRPLDVGSRAKTAAWGSVGAVETR